MEEYNPWWYGEEHPKYIEWKESEIKWIPGIVKKFNMEPFSLNFVIGPRQIGKTTSIAIFVHEVLLNKFDPRAIFYFPCDELTDFKELGEVLDNYLNYRGSLGIKSSIIFLDEITFVEDWWRAIKLRIDTGRFRNDVIYILGSASIDLIAGKERFPGRRGHGVDYYVLPLSFNEYVKFLHRIPIREYEFDINKIDEILNANRIFKDGLSNIFRAYLKTGGFPLAIKEFYKYGRVIEAEKAYIDWLRSDVLKAGKSEKILKEILSYVIRARLTPISWNGIAKETGIGSPHTVRSYIELLKQLFVIKVQSFIDARGNVLYRKNKKIHITDPFLYNAISRYVREKTYEEQIVESIVAIHLARLYEIYYWKNASEIDTVIKTNKDLYGFEVKWRVKIPRKRVPIKTIILDKEIIPLFLASTKWYS